MTYGLDRIGMMLQGTKSVQSLVWAAGGSGQPPVTWGDLWLQNEREFSRYNFEQADVPAHFEMFAVWEREAARLLDQGLVMPGYDAVIKCSHLFNVLDARGAISVSERVGYIGRVRKLARRAAQAYVRQRRELGFPMIADPAERQRWLDATAEREPKPGAGRDSRKTAPAEGSAPDAAAKSAGKDRRRKDAAAAEPAAEPESRR